MENTIRIPTFLHKIHGKPSNWFDIFTTHLLALLTLHAILFFTNDLGLPSWRNGYNNREFGILPKAINKRSSYKVNTQKNINP